MHEEDRLAERFETYRPRLRGVAHRMLGSASQADDAVQEAWFRLSRADVRGVENLAAWLTTVVSRICLDMLRARKSRREELATPSLPDAVEDARRGSDPEEEALLEDSVGRALLVVLDRLTPDERVAVVLHDMFAVPFDELAPILGRSPVTTKKLASRARRKVQGTPTVHGAQLARHRRVVEDFLAASRAADLNAVLALLAPDVVRRADAAALPAGRATEVRGAQAVAEEIVVFGRNSRFAETAMIDGDVGVVVAPRGRLLLVVTFTIEGDTIAGYELIAAPDRLEGLDLAVVDGLTEPD
jgi:RNA polymerase sigma-70 factor (ECF subfamily)